MALVASFATSLRSGANDATRATNKQYALQKSSYCPIRQDPDIKGIVIGKEETKVLQYADDTTATLADVDSAKSLFKLMDFSKYFWPQY